MKRITLLLLLLLLTFFSMNLFSEENKEHRNKRQDQRHDAQKRDGQRRGARVTPNGRDKKGPKYQAVDRMKERLKKENPELYKELMNLKKNHPDEFRKKMVEFMRKNGEGKKMQSYDLYKQLTAEEKEELKKLREEDWEQFEKRRKELFRKLHEKAKKDTPKRNREGFMKIRELLHKYHNSDQADVKDQIKSQLREKLSQHFDERILKLQKEGEQLETKLLKIKGLIQKQEENKDNKIEENLERLLNMKRKFKRKDRKFDGPKKHDVKRRSDINNKNNDKKEHQTDRKHHD